MTIATHKDGHIRKTRSNLDKEKHMTFPSRHEFHLQWCARRKTDSLESMDVHLGTFQKGFANLGKLQSVVQFFLLRLHLDKNYKDNNSVSTTFALNKHHWPNLIWNTICSYRLSNAKKNLFCSANVALDKGRSSVLQQTRKANFAPNPKATHALPIRIQPRLIISPNDPTSKANEPQKQ